VECIHTSLTGKVKNRGTGAAGNQKKKKAESTKKKEKTKEWSSVQTEKNPRTTISNQNQSGSSSKGTERSENKMGN